MNPNSSAFSAHFPVLGFFAARLTHCLLTLALGWPVWGAATPELYRELLYEKPPTPSCHASTLCEIGGVLTAAWFAGKEEKAPDVGIWFSRREKTGAGGKWTAPVEIFNGRGAGPQGERMPCWNPVLFEDRPGQLALYYKVGPSPDTWWGMVSASTDGGRTWRQPERLPGKYLGPIKNKPVRADANVVLFPTSTEDGGWRVVFERHAPIGNLWQTSGHIPDPDHLQGIQPTVLKARDGRLISLGRTRAGTIFRTVSADDGMSWTPLARTDLPNPNSGIDAVTLTDGRHVLIYNHTLKGRSPLNVAVSTDDASTWSAVHVLESQPGEYSYPAVIQTADGLVHISYTWKRERIRHVVLDPRKFSPRPIQQGRWPTDDAK